MTVSFCIIHNGQNFLCCWLFTLDTKYFYEIFNLIRLSIEDEYFYFWFRSFNFALALRQISDKIRYRILGKLYLDTLKLYFDFFRNFNRNFTQKLFNENLVSSWRNVLFLIFEYTIFSHDSEKYLLDEKTRQVNDFWTEIL